MIWDPPSLPTNCYYQKLQCQWLFGQSESEACLYRDARLGVYHDTGLKLSCKYPCYESAVWCTASPAIFSQFVCLAKH